MEALIINDKEIHSLEELRQNFDLSQVVAAFLDCSLEKWLADCFYEKQSDQVRKLDHTIGSEIERELCRILGIDYIASGYLSDEQQQIFERKCRIIQQFMSTICAFQASFLLINHLQMHLLNMR